jgi:hypothetical protein
MSKRAKRRRKSKKNVLKGRRCHFVNIKQQTCPDSVTNHHVMALTLKLRVAYLKLLPM